VVWAGECDALFFTEGGLTPLHLAAVEDSVAVAALLVCWGADIDARAESGATPLHWAAVSGSNRVAELLIERGADVNARDKMGRTPLHYASNVDVAWREVQVQMCEEQRCRAAPAPRREVQMLTREIKTALPPYT
jgi:hypothetical protein